MVFVILVHYTTDECMLGFAFIIIFNGVRVLSPVLFSVYLDRLLEELARSGVDCHCGCLFAGALKMILFCWNRVYHSNL